MGLLVSRLPCGKGRVRFLPATLRVAMQAAGQIGRDIRFQWRRALYGALLLTDMAGNSILTTQKRFNAGRFPAKGSNRLCGGDDSGHRVARAGIARTEKTGAAPYCGLAAMIELPPRSGGVGC